MFVHRRFDASAMRMIYAVIFIFYICNVRSQDSSEASTAGTPGTSTVISSDASTNYVSDESSIITSANTASPTTPNPDSQQTTDSFGSISPSISTTTFSGTTDNRTTLSTTTIIHTTTIVTACPPGEFPFVSRCIDAATNGAVVITAFILSIISFIGVIGAASYLLFFRKYFSHKKNRMVTNYNVPEQEMRTSTVTDNKPSTLSPPKNQRRNSQGELIKKNLNPNQTSKDTTITTDSRPGQKTNVLDKQPAANNAKIKQRKQEHHSIHLDDNQF